MPLAPSVTKPSSWNVHCEKLNGVPISSLKSEGNDNLAPSSFAEVYHAAQDARAIDYEETRKSMTMSMEYMQWLLREKGSLEIASLHSLRIQLLVQKGECFWEQSECALFSH